MNRACLTLMLLLLAVPAAAKFRICNKTGELVYVAFVEKLENASVAHGWHRFEPDKCADVRSAPLNERYYNYYAIAKDALWGGTKDDPPACLPTNVPSFRRAAGICAQGEHRVQLKRVDVRNKPEFGLNIEATTDFANGCGSGWNESLVPEEPMGYDFRAACDSHDNCYSRCLQGGLNFGDAAKCEQETGALETRRGKCDSEFSVEIAAICKIYVLNKLCEVLGDIYYLSVRAGGKGSFNGREVQNLIRAFKADPNMDLSGIKSDLRKAATMTDLSKVRFSIDLQKGQVKSLEKAAVVRNGPMRNDPVLKPKFDLKGLEGKAMPGIGGPGK